MALQYQAVLAATVRSAQTTTTSLRHLLSQQRPSSHLSSEYSLEEQQLLCKREQLYYILDFTVYHGWTLIYKRMRTFLLNCFYALIITFPVLVRDTSFYILSTCTLISSENVELFMIHAADADSCFLSCCCLLAFNEI